MGHRELPLQMLSELKYESCNNNNILGGREKSARARKKRNPSDYDDLASNDKTASSGRGSESRERKKSKVLSRPSIDAKNKEQETGSYNVKNSKKKGSGKSLKGQHVISKADDINAPSSELLAELRSMACDYFYLGRSKYSDSLRRFYCSFRSYAFLDVDIAYKDGGVQPTPYREKNRHKKSSNEIKRQKKGINKFKEPENPSSNLASVKKSQDNAVGKKLSKKVSSIAKGSVSSMSVEKKEELAVPVGLESEKNYHDNCCTISLQKTCSDASKSKIMSKKRDGVDPGLPNGDPISILPDLNKNSLLSVEHVPFCGPSKNQVEQLSQQKKEGLVPPAGPTQNILRFNTGIINDVNQCRDGESTTREAGPAAVIINTAPGSFVQQLQPMEFFPKSEPKKRKRNEKSCKMASVIPDLNGNASEMMSPSEKTTLPNGNILPPEGKSQQKRANKEEDPGGSLTLNFAPGSSLPSKETLVATFSRYGLLKESEFRVLNDSTIHIAYERTPDVRFAYRSLEKSHLFGESLVSFDLNCVQEKKIVKKMRKNPFVHVGACKNRSRPVEKPGIAFMKQNVEIMKSTLEKMGDKISPEMRVKLENEIKVFLDKIGAMSGSSSSS